MWLVALLGSAVGCTSAEEDALGTIGLQLVGQAPSGTVYRLRDAIITVHGPTSNTIWNTENAPDQTSLSANVVVGDYSASVQAGWRLERLDGSVATTVTAQLASDNPVQFAVTALQRTNVPLQFRVNADVVDMSQGYDIVVTVEESPPLLAVANAFGGFGAGSVEVFAAAANGNVTPIRAISGLSTGLSFPSGVAVAGDQLIVCDEALGSINFYPTIATGNAAPSRRISGPSTGLSFPTAIAVFEGEIYVMQGGGTIAVFPLAAAGDVPPSRTLFVNGPAQGFAIDRGELYVASSASGIIVYPTTAVGFPQPSRTLFPTVGFCPGALIARGGEIYLTDPCAAGVRVFPEAASGSVSPLRTIAGPRTGLGDPSAIALFGGELYISDLNTQSVRVFPSSADGDVFPTRAITGATTNIGLPLGVSVF